MDGAFLVYKPQDITSFAVIEQMRRRLLEAGIDKKALPALGHAGTLDPFADGLLVVLCGRGVKLSRYFLDSNKTYEATILLGGTNRPGDPTEPILESAPVPKGLTLPDLQAQADQMRAEDYWQTPPMHSAKKKDGKPLYLLARKGIEIERKPELKEIFNFSVSNLEILSASDQARFKIHVQCSSGTYVRTLAQDFAKKLGTLGMLTTLRRTQVGSFLLKDSILLDTLLNTLPNFPDVAGFIGFDQLLSDLPTLEVSELEEEKIKSGLQRDLGFWLHRLPGARERVVLKRNGKLLAIAHEATPKRWLLERVFI